MAKEYIERTEELILAVNAGARAIENTKRYHGAIYTTTRFFGKRKDISYLQAAEVLRFVNELPAVDVVEVVRCKDCKQWGGVTFGHVCRRWSAPIAGMKNCTKPDDYCSYGERRDDDGRNI